MKIAPATHRSRLGFTLAEMMVAVSVLTILGTGAFYLFLNGFILYAKNTAENVAHDENRIAVNRLLRDIHAATSVPQLGKIVPGNMAANPSAPVGSWTAYGTNVTFWAESGTGPSAGIAFKKMGSILDPNGGPFKVKNNPGGSNSDLILIQSYTVAPQVGMEIVFPYYDLEGTITDVKSNGQDHYNVWVQNGIETKIKNKANTNVVCYYMSRYAYVVENGALNFYSSAQPPTGVTWPVTIARNIINEADRTLPAKPFTQATSEYVGINLTTEDSNYSNRKFKAVNTLVAGSVPIRAQLSKTQ
jgi:prepilin-type N-terminal cleavage/methylation domain-containing protein